MAVSKFGVVGQARCRRFWFAPFAAILASAGCTAQQAPPPALPPPPVTVARPVVQSVVDYEETTGRAEPVEAVEVRARVSGYLQNVTFQTLNRETSPGAAPPKLKEGDTVEAGTVLFEIDRRPYQAVLDAATAEAARAKAALDRLTAELARAQNLRTTNNISVEEFDKITADRAEAEAVLAGTSAQIDAAKLNVEFTQVKAPITGRLGRALVTNGNLVTADVTLLTTIVREDPVHVYFDLPEQVVQRYQSLIRENKLSSARDTDLPVEVGLANEAGFPHTGYIDFVDNRIDRATASLKLRGRFENAVVANGIRTFTPGMFVRVRIPASRPHEALLVNERSIQSDQGDKIVFVVEADGTARRRVVELGELHGRLREVTAGLGAEDRIVVNGLQRVRDGAKVTPQDGPMPGLPETPSPAASSP